MSILTRDAQDKVVKLLVSEGLISAESVQTAQQEVQKSKQPILAVLTSKKLRYRVYTNAKDAAD